MTSLLTPTSSECYFSMEIYSLVFSFEMLLLTVQNHVHVCEMLFLV